MAVQFKGKLQIGKYILNTFTSVKIETSWRALTDRATIKISNQGHKLDGKVNVGDAVKIWLGYDNESNLEFEGYISEIHPNRPYEIVCEDEMYQLKRQEVNKSWKQITLKELIKFLVPTANIDNVPELVLSPFRLPYTTKAKALQTLKDDFGIISYFRGKELIVKLAYTDTSNLKHVKYDFQRNIIPLKTKLVYRTKQDVKVKIKTISTTSKGQHITAEYGDEGGDTYTLLMPNINDKNTLLKLAKQEHDKWSFEGYQGEFVTWLLPFCQHSQIAELKDSLNPAKDGNYYIDSVVTEVTKTGGCRRTIKPGIKVS